MYKVVFSDQARRELKKIDKYAALFIVAWVRKNLEGCSDPRIFGKGLSANRSGQWRYRVGDYRLIAEIADGTVTILILNVGHRKDKHFIDMPNRMKGVDHDSADTGFDQIRRRNDDRV